ncbi:MAG: gluconate 2-dehydrogenase subunit 3 family protein [Erythrobacter sp.]|uniref:gluconate 2-dehydrogenase subunit 3 family protein n=1 Tax=Erythrobacter sp. TaxID=1042 RepID=UPI00329A33DC
MIDTASMDRRSLLSRTIKIAGIGVALPTFASLGACSTLPATLEDQMSLIGAISDRVIPETDTPGAIAAKVPGYISSVFDTHFSEDQQSDFVRGLTSIAQLAVGGFANASPEEQDTLLEALEAGNEAAPGRTTWRQLREMIIFGFYTSEEASQELAYEEIPGRYEACKPLEEVGKAWLDRGV